MAAVVGIIAALVLFPAAPDPIPADVPADVLWDFRLASLAELAVLWATLGLAFGLLTDVTANPGRGATVSYVTRG